MGLKLGLMPKEEHRQMESVWQQSAKEDNGIWNIILSHAKPEAEANECTRNFGGECLGKELLGSPRRWVFKRSEVQL